MLTVASLLAAMTIAGAFWVGVLAARRLRDWGEGRRALDESALPLALAAAPGAPPDDSHTRRVRALVAERLRGRRFEGPVELPRGPSGSDEVDAAAGEVGLANVRMGDVFVLDIGEPGLDGDYIVDGLVRLREGRDTTIVAIGTDGDRRRMLVGNPTRDAWQFVVPVVGHGIHGEPPRNIQRPRGTYLLERRGQASAACLGRHDRPGTPRAAVYLYRGSGRDVLWVERWGDDVIVAEGRDIDARDVTFLPGGSPGSMGIG